jgi:hypothetical protein
MEQIAGNAPLILQRYGQMPLKASAALFVAVAVLFAFVGVPPYAARGIRTEETLVS